MGKQLWAYLNAEGEFADNVYETVLHYEETGADGIYLYNYMAQEEQEESFLELVENLAGKLSVPLYVGCQVECAGTLQEIRLSGVKGIVFSERLEEAALLEKAAALFGKENVFLEVNAMYADTKEGALDVQKAVDKATEAGAGGILLKHVTIGPNVKGILQEKQLPVWIRDSLVRNLASELLDLDGVDALVTNYYRDKDMKKAKLALGITG